MGVQRRSLLAFVFLVVASGVGLVLTQALRHSDPVVIGVRRTAAFSPNGAGPRRAAVSFWLRRPDRVAVSVVDQRDDPVRTIDAARSVPSRTRVRFFWDGRDADGKRVADGRYRFRIGLAAQGRSLTLPQVVRLDTAAARPWIGSVLPPHGVGPLLMPGPSRARGRVRGTRGHDRFQTVVRTDVQPARVVARLPLPPGAGYVSWDGHIRGRPAPDGTYMLGIDLVDAAGNHGSYPASLDPLPRGVRGMSGVTVRRLAVTPQVVPARPGDLLSIAVDSRNGPWQWALRRPGIDRPLLKGRGRGRQLRLRLPARQVGLLTLAVSGSGRRLAMPLAVNGAPRRLLVVMPSIRWQSVAPVDQSGDGLIDTLPAGHQVDLRRPFPAGTAAMASLSSDVVPLVRLLGELRLGFDLTTDTALAAGSGPTLSGHSGVVFAGDSTWLPARTLNALSAWVKRGGRLLDLAPDGLRRTIDLAGFVASRPSAQLASDATGGVRTRPARSSAFFEVWKDEIGLFEDTGGRIYAPSGWTGTEEVQGQATIVAAAGPGQGTPGSAAWRLGRGLSIHPGIPGLALAAVGNNASRGLLVRALRILNGSK